MLQQKQAIFAKNVASLIDYVYSNGYELTFGDAYRSPDMAVLYASQGKGIIDSLHCKRLAIDLNLFKDGKYLTDKSSYEPFGKYWESLNPAHRWGGNFKKLVDSVHFEMQDL